MVILHDNDLKLKLKAFILGKTILKIILDRMCVCNIHNTLSRNKYDPAFLYKD